MEYNSVAVGYGDHSIILDITDS